MLLIRIFGYSHVFGPFVAQLPVTERHSNQSEITSHNL